MHTVTGFKLISLIESGLKNNVKDSVLGTIMKCKHKVLFSEQLFLGIRLRNGVPILKSLTFEYLAKCANYSGFSLQFLEFNKQVQTQFAFFMNHAKYFWHKNVGFFLYVGNNLTPRDYPSWDYRRVYVMSAKLGGFKNKKRQDHYLSTAP